MLVANVTTVTNSLIPISDTDAVILTAIVAAIIAIWGVSNQWAITRRQLTLQHISKTDSDRDMIEARTIFIRLAKEKHGLVKWASEENEKTNEAQAIKLVLNDFELTAIGCQLNIIDYTLLARYSKSGILKYWFHAAPFIYAIRARTKSPALFHEFEELARCMSEANPPKRSFGFAHQLRWRRR